MPGLRPPHAAVDAGNVSYADPRASDLVIHHMPGHFIRRLQQVAVKLFFARVGLDMTPVQFAALAAVAQRPRIDRGALERPDRLRPRDDRRRDRPARVERLARAIGFACRPASTAGPHHAVGQESAGPGAAGGQGGAAHIARIARCRRAQALRAPVPQDPRASPRLVARGRRAEEIERVGGAFQPMNSSRSGRNAAASSLTDRAKVWARNLWIEGAT